MKKRILVAMSGGIDSSIAAVLLKKENFEVSGIFVFFQPADRVQESYESAKKAADFLGIPLLTVDLSQEFQNKIIKNFIVEYQKGTTPNPCVWCNKYFKFGELLNYALQNNFDYLATGHYVKIQEKSNKIYRLITAKDKLKDQSYFLYNLNQDILKHTLFPLGGTTKNKVRKLAQNLKLPVIHKKESNDVCFIENADVQRFLHEHIPVDKGDIVDTLGRKIGQHSGLPFYTLGQRQGIKIGGTGPYYVVKKDFTSNQLVVTNQINDQALFSDKILIKDVNWVTGQKLVLPLKCWARHRYQAPLFKVEIIKQENNYLVKFNQPQRVVTPGQSLVFYQPVRKIFNKDFEVLSGGVII